MSDSETDSEYDSEYDSDYEEYENNLIYDSEEASLTRYNIILCELYNEKVHGITTENVKTSYLVYSRFKTLDIKYIKQVRNQIKNEYIYLHNQSHDIYRNYRNIIMRDDYIKPEIAQCIYLETQECVAILKTFWIRLIQRTWKNILKKRENIIRNRCHPNSLRHREITGKWPKNCLSYPKLRGMLCMLKNA